MNVLMLSDVFFPRINGVSTSIRTFRAALEADGHSVTLVAPDYGADDGHDVLRVPSRRLPFDPEDRLMSKRAVLRLRRGLAERRFDLVHVHTPFVAHYAGLALARELGIPCVETYHTFFEEYLFHYIPLPRPLLRAAARRFSREQCNAVDAVIVPSTAMQEVLTGYGVHTPLSIIPTGLDAGRFEHCVRALFRTHYNIDPVRPCMVHVGRVAHEKNIDFLLSVADRVRHAIPDVLLIIAGEGPALPHLKKRVEQLGLGDNVLFVGYLRDPTMLRSCYCAGDAFVFASRTETQGLVLLEAMALGVPVVSTAIMGTRDILREGRGALVAREDVTDFSDKVLRVLLDASLRTRLSEEARSEAAGWGAAEMGRRLVALYESLVSVPAATRRSA